MGPPNTKAAILIASFILLRPTAAFLPSHPAVQTSGPAAAAGAAGGGVCRQRYTLALRTADADIPGIADARLAGWRAGSPASTAADDAALDDSTTLEENGSGEPGCGDVVEYPLSDLVKNESNDNRQKGVAVIVSINKLRNDAWKLPEDILDKAELQVLCPDLDSEKEGVWMVDELETCAFANLGEMKVLKSSFNGAMDKWKRWTISEELSEGCGARDAEWEYDMI